MRGTQTSPSVPSSCDFLRTAPELTPARQRDGVRTSGVTLCSPQGMCIYFRWFSVQISSLRYFPCQVSLVPALDSISCVWQHLASHPVPLQSCVLSDLTMERWPGLAQSRQGAGPHAEAVMASLPSPFPGETHLPWAAAGHFSLCSTDISQIIEDFLFQRAWCARYLHTNNCRQDSFSSICNKPAFRGDFLLNVGSLLLLQQCQIRLLRSKF